MIGITVGGIGAVLFAILAGLMAGNIKNRQRNKDLAQYQTTTWKYINAAQDLIDERKQHRQTQEQATEKASLYEALKTDHKSLMADHEALKTDHKSLMADHEALKSHYQLAKNESENYQAIANGFRKKIAKIADLEEKLKDATQELKVARNRSARRLNIIERYDNGKMVGRTAYTFDSDNDVTKVESDYENNSSHENMLWHELDHLQKTAKTLASHSRYITARNCFHRSPKKQQTKVQQVPWVPLAGCSHGEKNDWVHWRTKAGTKSKRPSPILKTRKSQEGIKQHLLTFVTSSGLTQFWCSVGRCQKVEKPSVFASLSNDDIVCLCTKKQDSGKTGEEKADFREKLKGLVV